MYPTPEMRHDPVAQADSFLGWFYPVAAGTYVHDERDNANLASASADNHGDCPNEIEFVDEAAFLYSDEPTVMLSPSRAVRRSEYTACVTSIARICSCRSFGILLWGRRPGEIHMAGRLLLAQDLHDPIPNAEVPQALVECYADVPQIGIQLNVDAKAPVHDRIRYMIDQVAALGFGSFEEVVTAYYASRLKTRLRFVRIRDWVGTGDCRGSLVLSTTRPRTGVSGNVEGSKEQITQSAEEILAEEWIGSLHEVHRGLLPETLRTIKWTTCDSEAKKDTNRSRKFQDDVSTPFT